jgi:hypothetical protein
MRFHEGELFKSCTRRRPAALSAKVLCFTQFPRNNSSMLNQKGVSLLETVIAAGLVGFIALAMATVMSNMSRQSRGLNEKLAAEETFRFVTQAIVDDAVCTENLTLPSPVIFDSTQSSPRAAIPSGSIQIGGTPIITVGQLASPGSSSAYVASIDLLNIRNTGTPDSWVGDLAIGFDQTKLVQALRPVTVRLIFQTDPASAATAKRVLNCGNTPVSTSPTPLPSGCTMLDQWINRGRTTQTCPAGTTLAWGFGVPSGSQDGVDSGHLQITATSITVFAQRDSWRILGKCCP